MLRRIPLIVLGLLAAGLAACTPSPTAPSPDASIAPTSQPTRVQQVSRWSRESAAADRAAVEDTVTLLQNARHALGEPQGADRAVEMLERAESRLLTRDTDVGAEQTVMNAGPQARIVEARRALGRHNRPDALRAINDAIAMLQRGR